MRGRTKVLSVHKFRRVARRRERELQRVLDYHMRPAGVPVWALGVRVEKAGPFQWAVVCTEHRGH